MVPNIVAAVLPNFGVRPEVHRRDAGAYTSLRVDAELPHLRLQRGPLHPELAPPRPVAAHLAAGIAQRLQDRFALRRRQRHYTSPGADARRFNSPHRRLQRRPGRQNHRPLDEVLQLANVARPVVARQRLHRLRRNAGDPPVHAPRVLLHEIAHQQRDVLAPVAQRRHRHRENVQAVIQVGAEFALLHHAAPGRDWWPPPGARPSESCANCPAARTRAPAARAAAWSAAPAESRRPRPETWCRDAPVRSGRCAARWRR